MKIAIISPHTDDAIFSLGSFIAEDAFLTGEIMVISPFAGIPKDEYGKKKHTKLRSEHTDACKLLNIREINGPFFDDVYGPQNQNNLSLWLYNIFLRHPADKIYIPLGIHHPDHILIRDLFMEGFKFDGFYEELPYRILYPELASQMAQKFTTGMRRVACPHREEKEAAVKAYDSQVAPHLFPQLFVKEFIWSKE